jgi:glycosyltransferase involved in cell wall biosynthesis/SAM-dependent methyltransferase
LRLAYFSPLTPQRSGIADYSEELLPHLAAAGAEITLFVEGFRPASEELRARFPVRDYRRDPASLRALAEFDAVVYHMGNDHRYHAGILGAMRSHPGVVVFHDFALQDFFLGLARWSGDLRVYLDEVAACHGEEARREAADSLSRGASPALAARPLDFPLNFRLARAAEAIIVHSEWSRARFEQIAPAVPLRRVPMGVPLRDVVTAHPDGPDPEQAGHEATTKRGAAGTVRIASFGLINPDKGIARALRALASLRERFDFRYTLVGATNRYFDVRALVRECGLEDRVEITGHVTLEEFGRRIRETDIALNLRERTVGETSASLCRLMAAGVCSVVNSVGWFAELPDDAVVKVEPGEHYDALLRAYLERLVADARLRSAIGANARRYALAEHDIRRSAESYLSFISEVVNTRPRRRLVSGLSDELSALDVRPGGDEEFLLSVATEVAALAPEKLFVPTSEDRRGRAEPGAPLPFARPPAERAASPGHDGNGSPNGNGRGRKVGGVDYKRAAIEYTRKLSAERLHHLYTKPFYNLAHKLPKYTGEGIDADTFRHFCDFANVALALALPPERKILDVGCGSGWLSEFFARLGYDVTGVDISPDLVRMARERVARVPYGADHETPLRCRFVVRDIEGEPLAEEFDAVVCYDSLHHFEDERAVIKNLAAMTRYGGSLFILEGDRPEEGSSSEEELLEVMQHYGTLESPFSREYLRSLLDEQGFAIVGDYVSVNGLFERDALEGERLRVRPPRVNYLLCKRVVREPGRRASSVPDTRAPASPSARISSAEPWPEEVAPGEMIKRDLVVENTGDTLWLVGPAERAGSCMLGVRLHDSAGALVSERHGTPALPRSLAPGESATLKFELRAPCPPGPYTLKLDVVAQHVCWFEQRGSAPLTVSFKVRP